MKITKFFALLAGAALAFAGCEPKPNDDGNGNGNGNGNHQTSGTLTLSASKTAVTMGETVEFTVEQKGEDGAFYDVTSECSIYINDANFSEVPSTYTFESTGSYTFFATKGADNSNSLTITVLADMPELPVDPQPENLAFNHRILVIDHTGVNCGYCPGMTDKLLAFAETEWHGHYNEVTCHAGSMAGGDPGNSQAANMLNQFQSSMIEGYPNICLNFYSAAIGNYNQAPFLNYMDQAFKQLIKKDGADAGISMAVTGDSEKVYCAAQIKSNVAQEYKVVAWLLESNIYSPNQSGATKDYHKLYNYALRNISGEYSRSNVSGEEIGVIEIGDTYNTAFELPIVSTKWHVENMGVLVIVSAKDANNRWEVVNSAYCTIDEGSKPYEYVD